MRWMESIEDVSEQIHVEDPTLLKDSDMLLAANGAAPAVVALPTVPPEAGEAFSYWQSLYLKYVQIFRKLEECYDSIVHPQKRLEIKKVLELTMIRIVQLKHALVFWHPVNKNVKEDGMPFPWEYVNFDEILVDLKLSPETLNVPVPRYFKEDRVEETKARDRLVQAYMNSNHGVDSLYMDPENPPVEPDEMTMEEAVAVIQRNERGLQGRLRALKFVEYAQHEKKKLNLATAASRTIAMDSREAAMAIQKIFRGHQTRKRAKINRDNEAIFIQMKMPPTNKCAALEEELSQSRLKRKVTQKSHKEHYVKAQGDLYQVVKEEEGPMMRDRMVDERMAWIQAEMLDRAVKDNKDPILVEDFYNKDLKVEEPEEEAGGKGKGDKKDDKKDKGKKEDKGKGKGKGKKDEPKEKVAVPLLYGPTEVTTAMNEAVTRYNREWRDKDESKNPQQAHDEDVIKKELKPSVMEEVRQEVDAMLVIHLENLQKMSGDKGKKKGKGKKKDKKGKGKKGKKGKDEKVELVRDATGRIIPPLLATRKVGGKALPGLKTAGKEVDNDAFLNDLVAQKMIFNYKQRRITDFAGSFNYLGNMYEANGLTDPITQKWMFQNPSIPQVVQNITEYAILPLGCDILREKLATSTPSTHVRSILLYGPSGSGKTALAEAIASETNALFVNLSPNNIDGKFTTKEEPIAKLLHMIWSIASDPTKGPVVVYIDEAEKFFGGGKKPKADDPARIKKDLITYMKALTPYDNIIIIGNSREPWNADNLKEMREVFDRFLYIPWPDYSASLNMWNAFVKKKLGTAEIPESLDLCTLARVSEGYTPGTIIKAVETVLTERTLKMRNKRPLKIERFIDVLSRHPRLKKDNEPKFREFTEDVSQMTARYDAIQKAAKAGGGDGGKDAKKGKK
jgi:hypothetical protein